MGVGVEFTPEDKDHMGPTCAKHSTTQDMKSCSKGSRPLCSPSPEGKRHYPGGTVRNREEPLLKYQLKALASTGTLPRMLTLSLDLLAFNSKVVMTRCTPLSSLCVTMSLAASSGAQHALELSLMGRVAEAGSLSSDGCSKG